MAGSPGGFEAASRLHRATEYLWYALGLGVTLALGMANLYYPFGFDQSVFLVGAKAIDQGAVLYVDYWDNKQPALYYFWVLAGRLFGFTEFGIHMLELLWLMAFSVVLIVTLRGELRCPWLAALAPVATVGVYYATVGADQLTQLEMLVSFPIYLALWFAYKGVASRDRAARYLFISGLCAGVVVCFKLLVSGIVLAIWAVATIYAVARVEQGRVRALFSCWIPAGLGSALPVGAVLLFFWSHQALDELIWTAIGYPSAVFETSPAASRSRLVTASAFYLSNMTPWLLFVGVAVWSWWRSRRELLTFLMLTWLFVAVVIVGVQSFSWWMYHTLLLFVPTGILAVLGIDRVVAFVDELGGRAGAMAMLGSLFVGLPLVASLTGPFLKKAQPLISETLVQRHGLQAYHWEVSKHYKPLWMSARFLSQPQALPGPIYSFGHGLVYHFSGRECAHRVAGPTWRWYLPDQLQDIMDTLKRDAVPYVYVGRDSTKLAMMRPKVWAFLRTHYEIHRRDESGIWLRWRGQTTPAKNR